MSIETAEEFDWRIKNAMVCDWVQLIQHRDSAIAAEAELRGRLAGWDAGRLWANLRAKLGAARALKAQCEQDIGECDLLRKRPKPGHLTGEEMDARIAKLKARADAFATEEALLDEQIRDLDSKYEGQRNG